MEDAARLTCFVSATKRNTTVGISSQADGGYEMLLLYTKSKSSFVSPSKSFQVKSRSLSLYEYNRPLLC